MSTKLFGLKNCDTCKKALKDLEASGAAPEFVDIRAEADLKSLLPRWIAAAGEKLVNRSSTTWRGLSDADKARASGSSLEGLLLGNPTLIKRPVIEAGGEILVGWTAETKARLG
jgi:arsenate reductase (glutaredoxin)